MCVRLVPPSGHKGGGLPTAVRQERANALPSTKRRAWRICAILLPRVPVPLGEMGGDTTGRVDTLPRRLHHEVIGQAPASRASRKHR